MSKSIAADISQLLDDAEIDLDAQLRARMERISERGFDLGPATTKRLQDMLGTLRQQNADLGTAIQASLADQLDDVALTEGRLAHAELSDALPSSISVARTPATMLHAIVTEQPFQGAVLKDWVKGLETGRADAVERAIRIGLVQGESIDQMVRRIRGTKALGYTDGALQTSRRWAETVARTAAVHVSNRARETTFEQNQDLIGKVGWAATLDHATCFVGKTEVLTPSGLRRIDSIRPGELVIGGSGQPRRVLGTMVRPRSDLVELRLSNGAVVQCTPDHRFLTASGSWIEAGTLPIGGRLATRMAGAPLATVPRADMDSDWSANHAIWGMRLLRGVLQALQARQVLLSAMLLGERPAASGPGQAQLHMRALRSGKWAAKILLSRLLRSRSDRATWPLRSLWGAPSRRGHNEAQASILLDGLPCAWPQAATTVLPQLRLFVLLCVADQAPRWHSDGGDTGRDMLAVMPPCMVHEQFSPQSEDQCSLLRGEASKLAGRAALGRQACPGMGKDPAGRTQALWAQVRRLWNDRTGVQGAVRAITGRGPSRTVLQLHRRQGGEPTEEPAAAVRVVPPDRRGETRFGADDFAISGAGPSQGLRSWREGQHGKAERARCDRDPAVGGGDSEASDTFQGQPRDNSRYPPAPYLEARTWLMGEPTLVYDIEIEHDHSFIVGGVVVHNCPVCGSLDGKVFNVGEGPRPPAHASCRCTSYPITKTWRQMGIDADELPAGTRASMNGQVPQSTDYPTWLGRQSAAFQDDVLGPTKAKLFREGLPIERFVDAQLKPLTVASLQKLGIASPAVKPGPAPRPGLDARRAAAIKDIQDALAGNPITPALREYLDLPVPPGQTPRDALNALRAAVPPPPPPPAWEAADREILKPRNFDENRKAWIKEIDAGEDEFYGIGKVSGKKVWGDFVDKVWGTEEQARAAVVRMRDNSAVYMAMPSSTLRNKIIKGDKRFKNSLETGKGSFKTVAEARVPLERSILGIASNIDKIDDFPKYGFMSGKDAIDTKEIVGFGYGDTFVKFKTQNIAGRTTMTLGDSFNHNAGKPRGRVGSGNAPPVKLDDPDARFWQPYSAGVQGREVEWTDKFAKELNEAQTLGQAGARTEYVEAQIYGKVTLDDVETVFTQSRKDSVQIRKDLDKAGYKDIEVRPFTQDSRLKELAQNIITSKYKYSASPRDIDRLGDYYIEKNDILQAWSGWSTHPDWAKPYVELARNKALTLDQKRDFLREFAERIPRGAEEGIPKAFYEDYRASARNWTDDVLNEELLVRYPD